MKELAEYRVNLMKRLEESAKAFRDECLRVDDPYASLGVDGWTVHQIAVHVRDVDQLVYGSRARQTAAEENPEFPNFDGEAYMTANYISEEPLEDVVNRFVENVRRLVEWTQTLPGEAWSRPSRHTTLGNDITLQSWVEKDLAHMEEHLETLKKQNKE